MRSFDTSSRFKSGRDNREAPSAAPHASMTDNAVSLAERHTFQLCSTRM